MKFCQTCGRENEDSATTCKDCKASLGTTSRPRPRAASREQEPPGASGLLVDPNLWAVRRRDRDAGRRHAPAAPPVTPVPEERHLLVPPLGEPLRLDVRAEPLVIGRDDESCDVVIASATVSRKHAQIVFKGDPPKPWISDLATRNGTLVNGVAVEGERLLVEGDVVRLGDVSATYRYLMPGQSSAVVKAQRVETVPVSKKDLSLDGDLAVESAADLLQRLQRYKITAVLHFKSGEGSGRMVLVQGVVEKVESGALPRDAALAWITALRSGSFRLVPGREDA